MKREVPEGPWFYTRGGLLKVFKNVWIKPFKLSNRILFVLNDNSWSHWWICEESVNDIKCTNMCFKFHAFVTTLKNWQVWHHSDRIFVWKRKQCKITRDTHMHLHIKLIGIKPVLHMTSWRSLLKLLIKVELKVTLNK